MTAGKPPPDAPGTGADPPPRLGPRWLGALVPRIARPAFRRKSPAAAALMADWQSVIGPALAAVTQPVRLARGPRLDDGSTGPGTLGIRCAGPVALELQHLAPQLLARINAWAGFALVGRLRFERGSVTRAPPAPARPPPAAPADTSGLDAIADPELRAALAALRASLQRKDP
ncbi:MAG: DUF721 domain-containing protein [Acetobacteraceae bacterium]|nr:DUF721 domain-containing protein [Acetobacteraceae bacterium]